MSWKKQENDEKRGPMKTEDAPLVASQSVEKQESAGHLTLWLLRKSIVPVLCVIFVVAGLYIGYVVVGDGEKQDVFEWSTWRHMYDLIFADS